MAEDILPKEERQPSLDSAESLDNKNKGSKKRKISILGVFVTVILTVILILLGERILFDLNRVANPIIVSSEQSSKSYNYRSFGKSYYSDRSVLSDTVIRYPKEKKGDYYLYKMLIHAAFVIPLFLLMIWMYFRFNLRQKSSDLKIMIWGYVVFSFWLILHLLGEVGRFVFQQYKEYAVYIVLILLAVIFSVLAVILQKRVNKKEI